MRLFRGAPVQFECRCSQGRVTSLLRAWDRTKCGTCCASRASVTVTCEFCHRPYRFDAGDVEALFGDGAQLLVAIRATIH